MSNQVEAALIARLLVDPRPIADLQLDPADFGNRIYRDAFRAMKQLVADGKPVDLVTLSAHGVDLDDALDVLTPGHSADVAEYATLIRTAAFRRRFSRDLTSLAEDADNRSPQSLIDDLHEVALNLASGIEPQDMTGRVRLADHSAAPPDPFLGVLSPAGTTVLYGDGGDGKGWVAAKLISGLDRRVAILDFEMQPSEWGYRLSKFGKSLDDVLYFSPPMTLDRWATARTAELLAAEGVGYLVVDSAMYASDVEDPYSPNGALAYGRARRRLNNLPALLLAHVTGNTDKVFGSVFWRNECRISWRLVKDRETRERSLVCRKANGYSKLEGTHLKIAFDEPSGTLELYE